MDIKKKEIIKEVSANKEAPKDKLILKPIIGGTDISEKDDVITDISGGFKRPPDAELPPQPKPSVK